MNTEAVGGFEVQSDGRTCWVNTLDGEMAARLGTRGYEVQSGGTWKVTTWREDAPATVWIDFATQVESSSACS